MWVIYKHTNLINGKIYIGQTCQKPEDRWDYGCAYKKHNLHLYNAIKKYGWQEGFSHEIIETNIPTIEEANEKEKYWIAFYNCKEPNGYNQNDGGGSNAGYKVSNEVKLKIGIANGKPVKCLETDEIFYSAAEAGRQLEIEHSHITDVCNAKRTHVNNLHWEYVDNPLPGIAIEEKIKYLEQLKHKRKSKAIKCIELNRIFDGAIDAQNELGICRSSICVACKNPNRKAGGYHWEYYIEGENNVE